MLIKKLYGLYSVDKKTNIDFSDRPIVNLLRTLFDILTPCKC